jgi:hypothetical protein
VEIVSPANKDRARHVDDFVAKVVAALAQGIHVAVVDLFLPGRFDPAGMEGAVWQALEDDDGNDDRPAGSPLTLASYVTDTTVDVYVLPRPAGDLASGPRLGSRMRFRPWRIDVGRRLCVPRRNDGSTPAGFGW